VTRLKKVLQILLFALFIIGGLDRFFQPIDVLAERMLWVSFFDPVVVRAIAVTEIACGIGLLIPFFIRIERFKFTLFSGSILIVVMAGAAVTHVIIGDYDQIAVNLVLIAMISFVIITGKKVEIDPQCE
jgi:uncharacterized membrane protein YphA (DoxX/SURF4 family)